MVGGPGRAALAAVLGVGQGLFGHVDARYFPALLGQENGVAAFAHVGVESRAGLEVLNGFDQQRIGLFVEGAGAGD